MEELPRKREWPRINVTLKPAKVRGGVYRGMGFDKIRKGVVKKGRLLRP